MARPWLLLPIETKAREFDAKLLLAAAAAEAGFDVVLGDQTAIVRRLDLLPHGAYLDKSVSGNKIGHFRNLAQRGFRIAAWCEEGLIYPDRDYYLKERIDPAALELTDRFFCWGPVQRDDILLKAPDAAGRLAATGNPRLDVLRPELRGLYADEAAGHRDRHGDFLLVNTNFGRVNHGIGPDFHLAALRQRGVIRDDADLAMFRERTEHVGRVYGHFRAGVRELSRALPGRTIVLRPHPSEDHDRWRADLADLPNVRVVYEGAVVPWLMAARVAMHCNCTTGVEGFLLDRPVVAYRPAPHPVFDSPLPNAVSRPAWSLDELVGLVEAAFAGDALAVDGADAAARRYLAGHDGGLAADRVAAELAGMDVPVSTAAARRLAHAGRDAMEPVRDLARRLLRGRDRAYTRRKFPGLGLAETALRLDALRRLTGRFERLSVQTLGRDVHRLVAR